MIRLLLILCSLTSSERVRRQEVPEPIFPFPEELTTRGENITVEIWTVDPFENSTDIWNATEFADYNSTEFWSNSTDMYELTTIEEESNSTWFSISTEYPNLNSTEIFVWTTEAENSTIHYEPALTTDQDNSTEFYTEKTEYYGTSTIENILSSATVTTISLDSTDQTVTEAELTKYSTIIFETVTDDNQNSTDNLIFTETVFWTENINSTEANTVTENQTSYEMSTSYVDVTTEAGIIATTAEFSTTFENSTENEWLSQSTESLTTESNTDSTDFSDTSSSLMTTEFESLQANYTEEIMLTTVLPTVLFSSTIFENSTTVDPKTFESTTENVAENSTAMMTSADQPITESLVFQSTEISSSFAPFTENVDTAETTYSAINSTSDELFSFATTDPTTYKATDITVTEHSMTTRNEASLTSSAATENPNTNPGTIWTPNENTTESDSGTTANLISEESTVTVMPFTSNTVESTSEFYFTTDLISTENPSQSTSSEGFSTSPTVSPIIFSTIADTTAASETATINFFTSEADLTSETNSMPITSALSFSSVGISTTEISSTTSSEGITTEVSTDGSTASMFSSTLEFTTPTLLTSQASSSSLPSVATSNPPTTSIMTTTAVESTTTSSSTPIITSEGTTTVSASTTVTATTASASTTTEETTTTASSTTVQETTSTTPILTTLPEEQTFTVDDRISLASNTWQDEYSDLDSLGAKVLIPDVIHDLDLILATNGDLTKIEISVESLEEITARAGGTTVNFRVTASVAGTEDDFINSYNDNFNTFSDYQSLKVITRTDIDSKEDISNDNFVSSNNNNTLSTETIIIIAVSIAAFILIVVIVISVCCYCRHKRQKKNMKNDRLSTLDRGPIEDGYFYRIENGIRISTPTERLI